MRSRIAVFWRIGPLLGIRSGSINQRGLALLITVSILSLLIAVTIQFHRSSWLELNVAHNFNSRTQLDIIAKSGFNIGRVLLEEDGQLEPRDTLLDDWASLSEDTFKDHFANGELHLSISDSSGYLQINALVDSTPAKKGKEKEGEENLAPEIQNMLYNLLISGQFVIESKEAANIVVDSLVDWIDVDDRESDNGAEDSYYQSLENPYYCRNGAIQYIEELLFVRGISHELFYGNDTKKGLKDFLTIHGTDSKININTAPILLIKAMNDSISIELLKKLEEFRTEDTNIEELSSVDWYKRIGGWPSDLELPQKLLTTRSTFFYVEATAKNHGMKKRVSAQLERTKDGKVMVLSKKIGE